MSTTLGSRSLLPLLKRRFMADFTVAAVCRLLALMLLELLSDESEALIMFGTDCTFGGKGGRTIPPFFGGVKDKPPVSLSMVGSVAPSMGISATVFAGGTGLEIDGGRDPKEGNVLFDISIKFLTLSITSIKLSSVWGVVSSFSFLMAERAWPIKESLSFQAQHMTKRFLRRSQGNLRTSSGVSIAALDVEVAGFGVPRPVKSEGAFGPMNFAT
mmetsp:Transcript_20199/g.42312  ORF Transcript_20199/g.42312 Transcript_20199/m.42312 type:complete len:214 (-) Transcript_20199:3472-4113(-)